MDIDTFKYENEKLKEEIKRYKKQSDYYLEQWRETEKSLGKIEKENNELKKNIEIYKKEYNHIFELREKAEKTLNFKSIILGSISSNYEEITDIDNLKNLLRIMFELEGELLNE